MRTPSINVTSGSLSGGNQQKLIIGREMRRNPRVLVAAHPTRGVDVGAQAAIWDHIKAARRNGLGVLLISADLEELVGLSDTIRVILRGKLSGEFDPDVVTREELGAAMTGAQSASTDDDARSRRRCRHRRGEDPMSTRFDARRIVMAIAAPLLSIVVAVVVTSIILFVAGDPVGAVWAQLFKAPLPRQIVAIINAASVYYLSAIAVAIGFRMNLFNIGVDGQYRVASFAAALFAGQGWLPGWLNIIVSLFVAMASGALWAGIAGILKVTRGVSEVISTIMLNSIATFLVAFLLGKTAEKVQGSNATNTKPLPPDSRVPGISVDGIIATPSKMYGLIVLAILVGFLYWFVLNKTRFGFDLRATGRSESAAVASGVKVKRMVLLSMLISGAAAGLVGMPLLFGQDYVYGDTFQAGLGFAGIAIALLGRNNPIGIAFAALLLAYLDAQGNGLQITAGVSDRLVLVIQGVIVLSVVIAYEVVRRANVRLEQRRVASELARQAGAPTEGAVA